MTALVRSSLALLGAVLAVGCTRTKVVCGRCVDSLGEPLAEVVVSARGTRDRTVIEQRTDANGEFRLHLPENWSDAACALRADGRVPRSVGVHATGDVTELGDLALTLGAELRGRLVDGQGNAIAGEEIELMNDERVESAVTASDGTFGTERLLLPGYWLVRQRHVAVGTLLTAGRNPPLTITRSATESEITGRVTDLDGRPIAGAEVTGFMAAPALHAWWPSVSGADGAFALTAGGPTPGGVSVTAVAEGYVSLQVRGVARGASGVALALRALRPGRVRVVDEASGEPIVDAVVALSAPWVEDSVTTGSDGCADFDDLPPGPVKFQIASPGGHMRSPHPVDVPATLTAPVDVAAAVGRTRQVHVRRSDGRRLGKVAIELRPQDRKEAFASPCCRALTNGDVAVVRGLPGVRYHLRVEVATQKSAADLFFAFDDVLAEIENVTFDDDAPLEIEVLVGWSIAGRVRPADLLARARGGPGQAPLRAQVRTASAVRQAEVGADGSFVLGNLPAADCDVTLNLPGADDPVVVARASASAPAVDVDLTAFTPVELDARVLVDGQPYTGRVQLRGDVGVSGAAVRPRNRRECVAVDGRLRCAVVPGAWRAVVFVAEPHGAASSLESPPAPVAPGARATASFAITVAHVEVSFRNARGDAVTPWAMCPFAGESGGDRLVHRRELVPGTWLVLLPPGQQTLRFWPKALLEHEEWLRRVGETGSLGDVSFPELAFEVPASPEPVKRTLTLPDALGY